MGTTAGRRSDLPGVDLRRVGGAGLAALWLASRPLAVVLGGLAVAVALDERLRRREHHRHVAPVLLGALLDDGELAEVLREAVQQHLAALGMGHLAAAEHDRDLDLVAPLQEAL